MGTELGQDFWSVVMCQGQNYIGIIRKREDMVVSMRPCYQINIRTVPVGFDDSNRPILDTQVACGPILLTFDDAEWTFHASCILEGKDMKDSDQARYKRLAAAGERSCMEARAAESGITLNKDIKTGA